jgi:hypothetical protein
MAKKPWEMTWQEWVKYYEAPTQGYGNRFLFAQRMLDRYGITSVGGEPLHSVEGINSRERWYNAMRKYGKEASNVSQG